LPLSALRIVSRKLGRLVEAARFVTKFSPAKIFHDKTLP
jgi:hypothetical protein